MPKEEQEKGQGAGAGDHGAKPLWKIVRLCQVVTETQGTRAQIWKLTCKQKCELAKRSLS